MRIVAASPSDLDAIAPPRSALWPDSAIEELKARADDMIGPAPTYLVLIAFSDDNDPIGFAEFALRTGIARALVEAGMCWGRERGAAEFASDAPLDNHAGHAFHRAIGFQETERVVYFRKPIAGAAA